MCLISPVLIKNVVCKYDRLNDKQEKKHYRTDLLGKLRRCLGKTNKSRVDFAKPKIDARSCLVIIW